jgi:hypothetical protein
MSVISLRRRITRLDRGIDPQKHALERLTDDELDAHMHSTLVRKSPELGERYAAGGTIHGRFSIFGEICKELGLKE